MTNDIFGAPAWLCALVPWDWARYTLLIAAIWWIFTAGGAHA